MKNLVTAIALAVLAAALAYAADDISEHRNCFHCGMDRKAYGFSRMLLTYADGSSVGVCSLHCAITQIDSDKTREPASITVADRNTRDLIDAKTAVWVIGGSKRGVMTQRAKWAFGSLDSANEFIKSYGGEIADWDKAVKAEREDSGVRH